MAGEGPPRSRENGDAAKAIFTPVPRETGGDQVEGARGEGEGEVVLPEVDAVCDTGRGRVRRHPIEGRGGHVDGVHAPALPGEPDRVATFAAAEVQRGART